MRRRARHDRSIVREERPLTFHPRMHPIKHASVVSAPALMPLAVAVHPANANLNVFRVSVLNRLPAETADVGGHRLAPRRYRQGAAIRQCHIQ